MAKVLVVSIEGNIGAGKSTLAHKLVENFVHDGIPASCVDEPLVEDSLAEFYSDPEKYALKFQMEMMGQRLLTTQKGFRNFKRTLTEGECGILLLDRSVWSDRVFVQTLHDGGQLTASEVRTYDILAQSFEYASPFIPSVFVFLQPSLEEVYSRIQSRGRPSEASITLDYLRRIEDHHISIFGGRVVQAMPEKWVPCITIKTDADFKNDTSALDEIYGTFKGLYQKYSHTRL